MGGGHDAAVDVDRLVATDALEHAVLQHAQQSYLRRRRELADLVEEQRAAVGPFEPTLALAHRAREAAALVAEQLRVDELGGDRPAVDADERLGRSLRPGVERPRDDLLARARLAEQQHRHVGATHEIDALHRLAQALARADDLVEHHGPADAVGDEEGALDFYGILHLNWPGPGRAKGSTHEISRIVGERR
jgi:hypothetical protein